MRRIEKKTRMEWEIIDSEYLFIYLFIYIKDVDDIIFIFQIYNKIGGNKKNFILV